MADRKPAGEGQPLPTLHAVQQRKLRDEVVVTSNTLMDSRRDDGQMGVESLPQTYQICPATFAPTAHITTGSADTLTQSFTSLPSIVNINITTAQNMMAGSSYISADVKPPVAYVSSGNILPDTSSTVGQPGYASVSVTERDAVGRMTLPQAGDVSRMNLLRADAGESGLNVFPLNMNIKVNSSEVGEYGVVSLPQTADIHGLNLSKSDVGSTPAQQTEDVKAMILPQTGDISTPSASGDVWISVPIPYTAADASRSHAVLTASVPQAGDRVRTGLPRAESITVSIPGSAGDTDSKVMLPQTVDVSKHLPPAEGIAVCRHSAAGISRGTLPQTSSLRTTLSSTEGVPQGRSDISGVGPENMSHAPSVSRMPVRYIQQSDEENVHQMSLPIKLAHVSSTNAPPTGHISTVHQTDNLKMNVVYPESDVSRMVLPQTGDVIKVSVPYSESNVGRKDPPQPTEDVKLRVSYSEAAVRSMSAPLTSELIQVSGPYTSDDSRLSLPQTAVVRELILPQTGHDLRVIVPESEKVLALNTQQIDSVERTGFSHGDVVTITTAGPHHPDTSSTSSTFLPHTSVVGVVDIPLTDHSSSPVLQSVPVGTKRIDLPAQTHADDINIRMMAEAAAIISRNRQQTGDINMRLIAETADYVSRNAPQTDVTYTSGNAETKDTEVKAIADGSNVMTPRVSHAEEHITNDPSRIIQQSGHASHGTRTKSSITKRILQTNSFGMTAAGDATAGTPAQNENINVRAVGTGPVTSRNKKDADQTIMPGFGEAFCRSPTYSRWKEIGITRGLRSDEDIACFLLKYYDTTAGMFPSSNINCGTCQKPLSVSCLNCAQPTASETNTDSAEAENKKKDLKFNAEEARKKLWKLIAEASSSAKTKEATDSKMTKGKDVLKPGKGNRRKPRRTRRVPPRKAKEASSKSLYSSDESTEEMDSSDSFSPSGVSTSKPEEQPAKSKSSVQVKEPLKPGLRKRGRPSNSSYTSASLLECSGCQKKFHTTIGLEKHIKLKRCKVAVISDSEEKTPVKSSTPSSLTCSDCKKQYRSKQGLMLHMVSKHSDSSEKSKPVASDGEDTEDTSPPQKKSSSVFECTECHKQYRSKQGLMLHKVGKHSEVTEKIKEEEGASDTKGESKRAGSMILECKECKKKYNSRPGLMLHVKTKHSPQVLMNCQNCSLQFKTKLELRIHIRRDHNKGQLVLFCPYCSDIFHNRDVLKTHMAEKHKTCRQVLYDCFACDLQFSSRIERKRHIQSDHKGKDTSLTCHYCGSWFATRLEFVQHEKEGHPDQNQSWLCATCGDSFPTRYLLQRHTLTHKEKVLCELCNKYITEPCFDDHMKRHMGSKAWQCEQCSKSFIRKAELQQHMLVHTNERPFCCELCGMRYREKSRLNSHMRTHTGIKPYKCKQCDKSFTRSRELKNHMRVHTGEKPFGCTVCGRKFASSGNLSAHRRKVHKLDPIPHGQQSRKHMLEEMCKPETEAPQPDPAAPEKQPVIHDMIQKATVAGNVVQEVSAVHGIAQVAHSPVPVTHQAPTAHQAPVAHQETTAVMYQQHMIPKYEPLVTLPEHYIPQPVVQPSQSSMPPIYWPNSSYSEES